MDSSATFSDAKKKKNSKKVPVEGEEVSAVVQDVADPVENAAPKEKSPPKPVVKSASVSSIRSKNSFASLGDLDDSSSDEDEATQTAALPVKPLKTVVAGNTVTTVSDGPKSEADIIKEQRAERRKKKRQLAKLAPKDKDVSKVPELKLKEVASVGEGVVADEAPRPSTTTEPSITSPALNEHNTEGAKLTNHDEKKLVFQKTVGQLAGDALMWFVFILFLFIFCDRVFKVNLAQEFLHILESLIGRKVGGDN